MTAADRYYSGTVTLKAGQWNKVTLDQPFAYDGEGCLCVAVHDKTGSWESNANFRCFTPSVNNQAMYYRNDNTSYNVGRVTSNYTTNIGPIASGASGTATDNYYDCQMLMMTDNGIGTAKLVNQMVGTALQGSLGADYEWAFTAGLYPRPASMTNNEWVNLYASACMLYATSATEYETLRSVGTSFALVGETVGTTWTSSDTDIVSIDGYEAVMGSARGSFTLTASLNDKQRTFSMTRTSSAANPIMINTVDDLTALRTGINSGSEFYYHGELVSKAGRNEYFRLDNDLGADSLTSPNLGSWEPIGLNSSLTFRGNFNGDGHIVNDLYIYSSDDYQGLFGYIDCGSISNLAVGGYIRGGESVGGICGMVDNSTISCCVNMATISGENYGIVRYCYTAAPIFSFTGGDEKNAPVVRFAWDQGQVVDCYYDSQWAEASDDYATGFLTSNMVGSALRTGETGEGWTDEQWLFTPGLYPRLASMANVDAVIASASPVYLDNDDDFLHVNTDFTVTVSNGVTWDCTFLRWSPQRLGLLQHRGDLRRWSRAFLHGCSS